MKTAKNSTPTVFCRGWWGVLGFVAFGGAEVSIGSTIKDFDLTFSLGI